MTTERSRAVGWFTTFASLGLLAVAAGADFFVAPSGNDAWSGTLAQPNDDASDGPLATLEQAQRRVRALKAAEPGRERPIDVALRGGTYRLDQPLRFGPQDSGTESAPVVFEAYADERPVISGGRQITGWKVDDQGRWQAELDEVKSGHWAFTQLFVDDQRRFRPRVPREGYYKIAAECEPSPKAAGRGQDRFGFTAGQIDPSWANLGDVEVIAFHNWATSRLRIASVDTESNIVTLQGNTPGNSSWAKLAKGHRFFMENVREALGEPGSWYLDRPTGRLTYVPREGERPDTSVVVAPRLERLVLLAGDVAGRQFVEHVTFRNLTFAHTNWYTPPRGQSFPQAEINLGAAVAAMAARHVAFENCAVVHVGEYAMGFGLGCRDNRVEGCELVDLGAGGVKIGSALPSEWGDNRAAPDDEEALVSHHTIRNCLIAHGGRLHPAAVGVWIGQSPYNVVEHNEVTDFYYTGFSVGWVWGYGPSKAHHNDVGFNHVHQIGQGVLSDMGAIYTLGVSPGTVIHDNRFHDVISYDYGGWGLYTDEGSTGIVMKNNVVYRCSRGCFHQHYGKENRVENNILAFGGQQQLQRTRTEEHISFFFERNIVYWDNGSPLLGSNWRDNNFRLDYNDYYLTGDRPITFPGNLTFAQWQEKRDQDKHSIIADPRFVDPAHDDFRLQPDSPAFALGFKAFDQSKAGRTSPAVLTAELPPVPAGFE